MITLDLVQGSEEWLAARLGRATASAFHRIITPATLKLSASSDGYRNELLAEWLLGCPLEVEENEYMVRGRELEAEAVAWYEMERDCDVERVGFVLSDDRRVGCSPDGFVGAEGGLEIKTPSAPVHVAYLLGDVPKKYAPQIQGGLWLTGRQWWDFVSYHPSLPRVLVRVERDEEYIAKLADAVIRFAADLDYQKERLLAKGCEPRLNPFTPAELTA